MSQHVLTFSQVLLLFFPLTTAIGFVMEFFAFCLFELAATTEIPASSFTRLLTLFTGWAVFFLSLVLIMYGPNAGNTDVLGIRAFFWGIAGLLIRMSVNGFMKRGISTFAFEEFPD